MAAKKNKGGRPQIGEEPIDIVSSIRLAKSDRAKIAAGAAACGMNKTMFMRQAVLNICELVTSENEDLPDLILLDLIMPEMNGFEFLVSFRESYSQTIPVLVLTGADLSKQEKEFLSSSAIQVLNKSEYSNDDVVQRLTHILSEMEFKNSGV